MAGAAGVNTIFIDVGKGPEPFTVISNHAACVPHTVIPDPQPLNNSRPSASDLPVTQCVSNSGLFPRDHPGIQPVSNSELLPQDQHVSHSGLLLPDHIMKDGPTEQWTHSQNNPSLPPELLPSATKPVTEPSSEAPKTIHKKRILERLKCPECSTYTAENEDKILRHIRKVHRGLNPFACLMCEYSTYNKTLFEEHVNIHLGLKPYKCSHCSHSSASKKNLKKHELIHLRRHLKCPECPRYTAESEEKILQHVRKVHRGLNSYACHLCEYSSNCRTTCERHVQNHQVIKPYQCLHCNYSTVSLRNLNRHMLIHRPDNPLRCTECPFIAKNHSIFKAHNRAVHKHIEAKIAVKEFVCEIEDCNYTTSWESEYNEHVKNCLSVKEKNAVNFQCQICDWSSKHHVKILLHLIHHPNQQVDESAVDISILRKHGIWPKTEFISVT